MLWTLNRHVKIFLHKSWAIFLQLPHRNFATFLSKLPLPLGKSWLHAWHLIFPWNCFPKKHLLFSQKCFPTNSLLKKMFSIFFKCLFPTFRFCFSLVVKLNLTHKKHFKFCFRPYFALFIYMVFVPVITNKIALVWILIYVLFWDFNNQLFRGYIDFIKLNQVGKYFLNLHCKVHKVLWHPRKIVKLVLTFTKINTSSEHCN